ncbi:unnamed protein product (macronuclear) [Paramecium tetraurelia]|uniref:Uncharacterized protein n=1 Tax=Paramecium tetraurelia TaxID=5888 RepID=A0BC10_PARTE|nr:uncharacterized protein GSPATT00000513001 [Paramecium tetraurelia]CAK56077.1 unnamed protein product [Paramecium tetraurelia]|eukprot:XP_001423475.1 hypothetical protein (macronuclear) [Paramecium tetraurelia strain d4-2]
MKYLVFLAMILVALSKRHHQPDAGNFDTCDNSTGCLNQLKKCLKVQERDPLHYSCGYECLEKKNLTWMVLNAFLKNTLGCTENEVIHLKSSNIQQIISYLIDQSVSQAHSIGFFQDKQDLFLV